MKVPVWLDPLTVKQEKLRAAHGLTAKRDGWYKRVGGKTRYICKPMPVDDAVDELERRLPEFTGIGKVVRINPVNLTIEQLAETFLQHMYQRVTEGKPKRMKRRTYDDYVDTLNRFLGAVGGNTYAKDIGPEHFSAFAKTFAAKAGNTRRREIQNTDRLFNWAGPGSKSMNLIPFAIRGPDWIKPSADESRNSSADTDKAYSVDQIKAIFAKVKDNPALHAWAHLGLNCAFGPKDIASLPESLVNLADAVIVFPRGKTGVGRICPLAPETVAALRTYLKFRSKLKSVQPVAADLFFRTRQGFAYMRDYINTDAPDDVATRYNLISKEWKQATGCQFSGLRSTLATFADDWPDERAIDMLMGHTAGRTGGHIRVRHYAKKFNPERVRRLVDYVWPLFFGRTTQLQQPSAGAEPS